MMEPWKFVHVAVIYATIRGAFVIWSLGATGCLTPYMKQRVKIGAATVEECKKVCENPFGNWTCKSAEWHEVNKRCDMADGDKDDYSDAWNPSCGGQQKYWDATYGTITAGCITKLDQRLAVDVADLNECIDACVGPNAQFECKAINFKPVNPGWPQFCYLLTEDTASSGLALNSCGQEYYDLSFGLESGTWEEGVRDKCSEGGYFRLITSGLSLNDCKSACENELLHTCRSISFWKTHCALSEVTAKSDPNSLSDCSDFVYFERKGEFPDKQTTYTKQTKDGSGAILITEPALKDTTADALLLCVAECYATPNCASFSYSTADKICRIFNKSFQDSTIQYTNDDKFESFEPEL